jgi:DNA-directed RNA polymerase subunit RPC12/RpoP
VGLNDSITFTCTACGHSTDFPKAQEGKAIYCPKCQAAQVVKGKGTDRFQAERIPTGRIARADAVPGTDRIEKSHGMAGSARIDFVCGACNHSARISAALSGQPVRCPGCGTVQLAGVTGMRVVRLDANGKLPFTCTACSYQARLSAEYAGKAIRCPKCQGAQVVPRVLREPSGAYQALPSGASVVRGEPGTGTIRREPGTGSIRKEPGTGSVRKESGTGSIRRGPAIQRSEPSSALRTPAGGIPVAQPMPQPTPLPGALGSNFATPPPGSITAMPEPQRASSSPQLPLVPVDAGDGELDLGDDASVKPVTRGSVVRRSGRMSAQRTPLPNTEPTLEPARAVQPEPDEVAPEPPRPTASAGAAPAPRPATAKVVRSGPPSWLIPVLGVVAAVGVIAAVALALMLSSATERTRGVEQHLNTANQQVAESTAEVSALKATVADREAALATSEAARAKIESDLADSKGQVDALKRDLQQSKTTIEQLLAEMDLLKKKDAAKSPASVPAGDPGSK